MQHLGLLEDGALHDELVAVQVLPLLHVHEAVGQHQFFHDDLGEEDEQVVLDIVLQKYPQLGLHCALGPVVVVGYCNAFFVFEEHHLHLCYLCQTERQSVPELQFSIFDAADRLDFNVLETQHTSQLQFGEPVGVAQHLLLLEEKGRSHLLLGPEIEGIVVVEIGELVGNVLGHFLYEILELFQVGFLVSILGVLNNADSQLIQWILGGTGGIM